MIESGPVGLNLWTIPMRPFHSSWFIVLSSKHSLVITLQRVCKLHSVGECYCGFFCDKFSPQKYFGVIYEWSQSWFTHNGTGRRGRSSKSVYVKSFDCIFRSKHMLVHNSLRSNAHCQRTIPMLWILRNPSPNTLVQSLFLKFWSTYEALLTYYLFWTEYS